MGICSSCESTNVSTAKLILQDGRLQEFSYPVPVSYVLQKIPMSFICNSDEMEFDDVVSAVSGDEVLQLGQLYFALPLSWLKHPLQPEEMAALAVKASSALMKSGSEKCGCRRKIEVMGGREMVVAASATADGGGGEGRRRRRSSGSSEKFTAMLSAIPE